MILQDRQQSSFDYDPRSVDDYQSPATSSSTSFFSPSSQQSSVPQDLYDFRNPNNLNHSPFESPLVDTSGYPSALEAFRDRASSFGSDRSSNHSPGSIAFGAESPSFPSLFPPDQNINRIENEDSSWMMTSLNQVGSMSIDDQRRAFPPVFDEEGSSSPLPPSIHHPSSSFESHQQQAAHQPQQHLQPQYHHQVPVLAISQPSMDVPAENNSLYQSSSHNQAWNSHSFVSEPTQIDSLAQPSRPHRPVGYQQMGESLSNLNGNRPNRESDYGSPETALQSSPAPLTANSSAPSPAAPHRTPSRDDSYDKLKRFLGLDIDIEGNQPTTIMGGVRKRSLSDLGPRGADLFGRDHVTEKAVLGSNLGQGLSFIDSTDTSWMDDGMRDKLGYASFDGIGEKNFPHHHPATTVMAMQYHNTNSPISSATSASSSSPGAAAVDPLLLGGNPEQQVSDPMLNFTSPLNNLQFGNNASGHQPRHGSVGFSPASDPSLWMGPTTSVRPSMHQRRGHKRGAQSEDLRSSIKPEGVDDFLAQITAPNGGLAPPTGPGGLRGQSSPSPPPSPSNSISLSPPTASSSGGGHGRGAGAPPFFPGSSNQSSHRSHPYRPSSSHARHSSFGSNHSNSSSVREELLSNRDFNPIALSNMMMPPHPAHHADAESPTTPVGSESSSPYNQTALPTYGGFGGEGTGQEQISAHNYVHAQVTTPKTQQASAMRRKTEAMYACPVAGCSSTFTR